MEEELNLENFFKNSPRDLTDEERAGISKAFEFAKKAHGNQKRLSGEPYFNHAYKTALQLLIWGLDFETIEAGFLHDVVEDTITTTEDLEKEFNKHVGFLVEGVTKLGKIKYRGREQESQTENLRKMFIAMAQDIRVVIIKLADRLHNMQTLNFLPKEKQKRIATETLEIYAPLSYRLGMGELRGILEDLCFPYVYPDQYRKLVSETGDQFKIIKGYLEKIKPYLISEIKKEGLTPFSVHARTKHLYSLWRKLQRPEYDGNIKKIYDLAAMRVVMNTVEECYTVLGVIHRIWKPLPGRIKDYIAIPKPNGYQSIHTTVFTTEGRIVEIQIRTVKMHEEAENGIAAHWAYSEQGKPESGVIVKQGKYAWVSQLKDWQGKIAGGGDEFIQSLKIDFFKDRIFVFTPKGEVINLPEGATPIDFAYSVHTDIGNHCTGVKINEKMKSLDTPLKNWDVVEIITMKNRKPSKDWLDIAKTAGARSKIRVALGIAKKEH
ncbi:MAG TPA: RelA/SpoT family protein [Patescibacteria group bacterium]|nr:RelA/SpoT family protein [Patescibacteria group bacterium]